MTPTPTTTTTAKPVTSVDLTDTTIEKDVKAVYTDAKKVITFGLSHIILITLLAASICFGVYLYDSKRADRADAAASQAQTIAQIQDKTNVQIQSQTLSTLSAIQQQNVLLQQQVVALEATLSQRDQALVTSQKNVQNLTPLALSTQWGQVAQEPAPGIDKDGNFLVALPLARKSVDALLAVPILTQDSADLTKQVTDLNKVVTNDNTALQSEITAHQSDVKTCTDDKTALNAQIVKVKADAAKSKRIWGIVGFVLGTIVRSIIK